MSVSFLRIDDRMIHGQTVTRWLLEYPCDGLIAVNDKAATTDALKMAYKSASTKKTFVWTYEAWKKKNQKVLDSKDNYFLITKDSIQMKKILVDDGFVPSDVKKVIVGPCNDRPGAVKLGNNQSITQEEAEALEAIKTTLPMDGIAMKTLFTVGSLLPCVGIAILLKQVVTKAVDFIPFFFGFTLAASMGLNLVSVTVVAAMFAIIYYNIKMVGIRAKEAINGIRAGLMGPLAGIGDSLVVGTLIPILLGIALGLSTGGSVAATWVSVKTSFHLVNSAGKEFLNLQNQLDGVYPGFLTAAFVIFCWWLMSKKKVPPVVTMLILVVVAFIGVMIGFFNPGLKY